MRDVPLFKAERLSQKYGANIWLMGDLNHQAVINSITQLVRYCLQEMVVAEL